VCELNAVCGTFEIPEFAQSGDISLINIDGDIFQFSASNLAIENSEALVEYFQILEDGTMRYVSIGSQSTSEAILILQ
jgi:hypothetical protein